MKKYLIAASAFALTAALSPALAQDPTAMTGSMSASDVGASPMTGTSATDYVKLADDGDKYEIQSSKLALMRSKRADVKALARQMITDHMQTSKSLMAALSNADRKITPPSMTLSAANIAKVQLLKKAPKASVSPAADANASDGLVAAQGLCDRRHRSGAETGRIDGGADRRNASPASQEPVRLVYGR